jgi:predicted alpha-1,6-mannanase (GH76 family)
MRRLNFVPILAGWLAVAAASAGQTPPHRGQRQDYLRHSRAGVAAMQRWYSRTTGLYRTTGWWNSANALTALIDYSRVSGSRQYLPVLSNTFQAAQRTGRGGFLNDYYDDEGWWALAWIDAYDWTNDPRYLTMAQAIFSDMTGGWDTKTCGGGIWWSRKRTYKNAIANELFLSVAAHLANRARDPAQKAAYVSWAGKEWRWFQASGMIDSQHLVNDGLTSTDPHACVNNGRTTWTYNQGVILGGLAEMDRMGLASGERETAERTGREIATAALRRLTDSNGILHDACEPGCGQDGVQFKGIFVRNLMAWSGIAPDPEYTVFVDANADSIWQRDRGPRHQFGLVWSGPYQAANAASQSSALDALVAAAAMTRPPAPLADERREMALPHGGVPVP